MHGEEGGEGPHDEEGKALAGRHGREQQQLADDIKKQEEARVNTLESTLRAQAARQKSLADETQKSETEAAAASLAAHDLTEETAAKIMKQYKDDAAVVGDMLANERRRQAEVMRARLAEQRFRRRKNLVREVFIIHVGGTRYVTSSTDNIMKIHAGITLNVEC